MESGKEIAALEQDDVVSVPAVIKAGGEDESTAGTIGMQDIFKNLVLQSNFAAHEAEAKLQVEEKGNNVAELQGFCAGIKNFKSVAKDAGFDVPPNLFDTANRMTPWVQKLDNEDGEEEGDMDCSLSLAELKDFSRLLDELTDSESYTAVKESMQNKVKAKKDFLYSEAKSSRDLFWTHGWHKGFFWVETQIKELLYWKNIKEQQAERKAKEKASMLPFGDDED